VLSLHPAASRCTNRNLVGETGFEPADREDDHDRQWRLIMSKSSRRSIFGSTDLLDRSTGSIPVVASANAQPTRGFWFRSPLTNSKRVPHVSRSPARFAGCSPHRAPSRSLLARDSRTHQPPRPGFTLLRRRSRARLQSAPSVLYTPDELAPTDGGTLLRQGVAHDLFFAPARLSSGS
jgi:hypothetical protein